MNIHTFKDVVASKRSALANELEDDEDDDREVSAFRNQVEGEEEEGDDKFNEIGEVMEPFNLHDERDRGHFDENMNFVFKKERGEVDAWLATMDEATMEKSIGEAAEAKKNQIIESTSEVEDVFESVTQMKQHLLQLLFPGETVTSALKRLSGRSSNSSGNNRSKKNKGVTTEAAISPVNVTANKIALNKLIGYVDKLLSAGVLSIYDASYEAIDTSINQWEYRALDGSIQGPYEVHQIAAWMTQGYFTGASSVFMRKANKHDLNSNSHINSTTAASSSSSGTAKRKTDGDDLANQSNKKMKLSSSTVDNDDLMADLNDEEEEEEEDGERDSVIKASISENKMEQHLQQKHQQQPQSEWLLSDDIDFSLASNSNNNTAAVAASFSQQMSRVTADRSSTSSQSKSQQQQQQQQRKLQLLQQTSAGRMTLENNNEDNEGEEDEDEVDEEIEEQEGSLNKRRLRFKLDAAATREADEDDASDEESE